MFHVKVTHFVDPDFFLFTLLFSSLKQRYGDNLPTDSQINRIILLPSSLVFKAPRVTADQASSTLNTLYSKCILRVGGSGWQRSRFPGASLIFPATSCKHSSAVLKSFLSVFFFFFSLFQSSFLLPVSHASLFLGWVILPTHRLFALPHTCSSGLWSHLSYCLRRNAQLQCLSKWGVCVWLLTFFSSFFGGCSFPHTVLSHDSFFYVMLLPFPQEITYIYWPFPSVFPAVWMHADSAVWVDGGFSQQPMKGSWLLWISCSLAAGPLCLFPPLYIQYSVWLAHAYIHHMYILHTEIYVLYFIIIVYLALIQTWIWTRSLVNKWKRPLNFNTLLPSSLPVVCAIYIDCNWTPLCFHSNWCGPPCSTCSSWAWSLWTSLLLLATITKARTTAGTMMSFTWQRWDVFLFFF